MSTSEPIVLAGRPVGRMKAGWLLFKETWRFTLLDKEMLWIPIIAAVINLCLFGLIIGIAVIGSLSFGPLDDAPLFWLFIMFLTYVAGAFTVAYSQAAIVHIVYTRVHGGDASLRDGLRRARAHWLSLLFWSLVTATVGFLLQQIAERSKLLGKFVTSLLGAAWNVLTYFVVPIMVIDNQSAFASIKKSSHTFKKTWGETLVSNFSYNIILVLLTILTLTSTIGLAVIGLAYELSPLIFIGGALFVVYFFLLFLFGSVMSGVLRVLLYVYADEGVVPENFNHELLENMMARRAAVVSTSTAPANEPPPAALV